MMIIMIIIEYQRIRGTWYYWTNTLARQPELQDRLIVADGHAETGSVSCTGEEVAAPHNPTIPQSHNPMFA